MDFIKMIMELPGEKRSQDVVEHTEWNSLWKLIVTQGNHSENYLEQLYDYFFNKEGWVHKVQAELDGVQPYLEGVMTQPVGKAPDGSLWTYPSTESGTVPWGNVMGDITRQQDLIDKFATKADTEHRHDINSLTFNTEDLDGSWIKNGTIIESAYGSKSIPTSALKDLSVTSEKLNNGAVTSAKIASSAVINDSIANGSVSGAKIADGAVTRVKLAQNALYSPMQSATATPYTVQLSDVGKTLAPSASLSSSTGIVFNIDDTLAAAPDGMEFAIFYHRGASLTINFSGKQYSACLGHKNWNTNRSYVIPELFGMCAIKKVDYDSEYNYWLVTGNVEVVS